MQTIEVPYLSEEAFVRFSETFAGRRNQSTILDFMRALVAIGAHRRTRKGFSVIRGSHKGIQEGLKDHSVFKFLGLTAAKIRGALTAAIEEGAILVVETADVAWSINWRRLARRAPNLYRFSDCTLKLLKGAPACSQVQNSLLEEPILVASIDQIQELDPNGGEFEKPVSVSVPPPLPEPIETPVDPLAASIARLEVIAGSAGDREPPPEPLAIEDVMASSPRDLAWLRDWPFHAITRPRTWPRVYDDRVIRREVLDWIEQRVGRGRSSWHQMHPDHGFERRLGFGRREDLDAFVEAWGGPS